MRTLLLSILFTLFSSFVHAQNIEAAVTIEDLQEEKHALDSDADAAFLINSCETSFKFVENEGFRMVTKISSKIKIYTKEGYSWANKEIAYYTGKGESERIKILEANTYNLVAGKIVKTAVKSEGIFDVKENDIWSTKKIILPNVKEGSIVEFVYTIESPYLSTIPEFQFQYSIPVNVSRFITLVPEYYVYIAGYKGFKAPLVQRSEEEGLLNFQSDKSSNKKFNVAKTTYTLNKVEALKAEKFVNNMDNYTASVVHDLSIIKLPNVPAKSLSLNINDLVKNIYKNKSFGAELETKKYFEKDISPILVNAASPEEKVQLILDFIKKNISWNKRLGYYCEKGVKKAYSDKSGNVADLNLMLTAMLRYAGLDANPVLVSTRANGIKPGMQRSSFNYVITAVEIDGGIYLLDATSLHTDLNILPIRVINWTGALIKKDGTMMSIDLYPNFQSLDSKLVSLHITDEGTAIGQIRDEYNRYNSFIFRENYGEKSKEEMINDTENTNPGIEIVDLRVENLNDLTKSVKVVWNYKHSSIIDVIGTKIYLNPMFFSSLKENPFKSDKREYPIDFVYPEVQRYQLSFKIPQGYKVDYLPTSEIFENDAIGMKFIYEIAEVDGMINFVFLFDRKKAVVDAKQYANVKDFFNKIIAKYSDRIVLNKI